MYRIRFHGRGGQGIKTASRILGNAFLYEGLEVQDAPRYGAERRGAPIFAYVRAARSPIYERGAIQTPDLVVVADESLVAVPAAGVLQGLTPETVLAINSQESEETWRQRLNVSGPVVTLPLPAIEDWTRLPLVGTACAGSAAMLVGVITRQTLERAIREELGALAAATLEANVKQALAAFDAVAAHRGIVREGEAQSAENYEVPAWVDLAAESVGLSGPSIYGEATSEEVRTGLWRILRPVVDRDRCNRCVWVCSSFCPDNAISVDAEGYPAIDYEHCKGCMICVGQCPRHAIDVIPESEAKAQEKAAEAT